MLMLLLRIVAFFHKAIFAWFILFATSVLHCPVFSSVVPRYLYCLTCVSRCPFTVTSHCFSGVFSTIIVLVFLSFIAIPYCSQVASSFLFFFFFLILAEPYIGITPGCKGKGKGSFYIAQYPVRWTAQSALHFLTPLADLFIPTPTRLLREAF